MTTITGIEKAVSHLPSSQLEKLAPGLEDYRSCQRSPIYVDAWLKRAVGAAKPGMTTAELMSLTRGDE